MVQHMTHQMLLPSYLSYTVRPGDTVESIAKHFHDFAWLIRRRNGGLWNLAPGQQIRVLQWPFGTPYYATRVERTDRPQYYVVQAGDTLGAIAQRLHTDVATLASENGLTDPSLIYAGQKLVHHHYSDHRQRVLVPGVPASMLHTGLLIHDLANMVPVDAALIKGVAWRETQWTMERGASGEIGMMQVMPAMATWVQKTLVGYKLDPSVRENNIAIGTLLLSYYLDVTHHDVHKALALYHSGDTLPSKRNGAYIRSVLSYRDYFYHHPRAGY